uniref:U37-Hexatoxin-Hc1a_1 n=1 Tax=Hadronyche cerberea TaxID=1107879 RepID=A0A4Q8KBT9_HADCE
MEFWIWLHIFPLGNFSYLCGMPYKYEKLPNGKMCSLPGDSCSKRDECCKPVNEKENSSGCRRTWSAMDGGFVNQCHICNLESSMC